MLERRLGGSHLLDLVLGEEAAGELWRADHLPRERLDASGEKARKGGLAIAVGAEERDAVVRVEPQIETRQDRLVRHIAGADPVERDQGWAEARRLRQAQRHRRRIGDQRDRFEPRQRLDPALRLARFRGLVAEAVDKALQPLALALLPLRQRRLTRRGLTAGPQKCVETAGIERELAVIEMQGRGRRGIQQLPVMADQDEAVPITAQKAFEP